MELRHTIKRYARIMTAGSNLKLFVVLLLRYFTNWLIVEVFTSLGEKIFPDETMAIFNFEMNWPGTLLGLLGLLLFIPIDLAAIAMFQAVVHGEKGDSVKFLSLFEWFSDGDKLKQCVRYFPWRMVSGVFEIAFFSIPASVIVTEYNKVANDLVERGGNAVQNLMPNYELMNMALVRTALIVILVFIVITLLFAAVPYNYVKGQSVVQAVKNSLRAMGAHLFSYILLCVSFIGWFVLCLITMGLAVVIVGPFFKATQTAFIEWASNRLDEQDMKKTTERVFRRIGNQGGPNVYYSDDTEDNPDDDSDHDSHDEKEDGNDSH